MTNPDLHDVIYWLPPVSAVLVFSMRMLELKKPRDTVAGVVRERWTLRLFVVAGWILLAGGITEYFLATKPFSWSWYVAGMILAAVSVTVRRSARSALGRYWSLHIEIRDTQPLITTGPFCWMRHPTYFSMLLELLAGAFMLRIWIAFVACLAVFLPVLWVRIRNEEAAMVERFGDGYLSYRQRTPAMIPFRFRWN